MWMKERKEKKRKDATKQQIRQKIGEKNSINEINESFTADVLPQVTAF